MPKDTKKILQICWLAIFVIPGVLFSAIKEPSINYPEFSWDTVPVFHHAARADRIYTFEQIEFIANKFSIVVFEKQHAQNQTEYINKLENAVLFDASRIKAVNSDITVLGYFSAFLDNCPYSWQQDIKKHPEWLLYDVNGNPLHKTRGDIPQFDITKSCWQQWWLYNTGKLIADSNIDGIFIDALAQIVRITSQDKLDLWSEAKYNAMCHTTSELLQITQERLPEGAIIVNNGLFADMPGLEDDGLGWLDFANSTMVEHFGAFEARDEEGDIIPEVMARQIELVQIAGQRDKVVLVKGWPGDLYWTNPKYQSLSFSEKEQLAEERLEFALAAFLIAAEEYSYFGYSWGWLSNDGWFKWYPEFEEPLGLPQNSAVRNGFSYSRSFEHADVYLDLASEQASIVWK
jgi:hypothetical protein